MFLFSEIIKSFKFNFCISLFYHFDKLFSYYFSSLNTVTKLFFSNHLSSFDNFRGISSDRFSGNYWLYLLYCYLFMKRELDCLWIEFFWITLLTFDLNFLSYYSYKNILISYKNIFSSSKYYLILISDSEAFAGI